MNKPDINKFYIKDYLCGECGSICDPSTGVCPVCGAKEMMEVMLCRSCLNYNFCVDSKCDYVSHIDRCSCPKCGGETRSCYGIIPEDQADLPVPDSDDCLGVLNDDGEGYQRAMRLKMLNNTKI